MKKILISAVLMLLAALATAQNLNPVVEVTNIYEREASGIEKPSQLLALPDSVLRFNLDFDYSVRSTPYQGAYEFKPYLVQLRPSPRPSDEGTLFVRAGAGYSFHPELTAIWTPLRKSNMRLNLYGDHRSYMGYYRNIVRTSEDRFEAAGLESDGGCDARSALGVNYLLDWVGGQFMADASYRNVLGADSRGQFSHNIFQFEGRVKSQGNTRLTYEAGTHILHLGVLDYRETHTRSDASLVGHFGSNYLRLGASLETVNHLDDYYGNVVFTPSYLFNLGRFHFDLGLKLSFLYRSQEEVCPHPAGIIFPDAWVTWDIIPDRLALQAGVTGGDHLQSYSNLLEQNSFIGSSYWSLSDHSRCQMDNSIERINTYLGVRGNISGRFHYDFKAGYQLFDNAFLWGFPIDDALVPVTGYLSGLLNTIYVRLDAGWKSDRIDAGAQLYYGYTIMPELVTAEDRRLFAPAPFRARAHVLYNWGDRIRAGADIEARSDMISAMAVLPGYADLGLYGDLQMTRTLGFWLRVGNLLNQTVQRVPFHAERGIYFTVGARFNF